jgi:Bacteriophage related domain of unknown function
MTEVEARTVLARAFRDGWSAAQPAVPFSLENDFDVSSDRFAALTIRLTTSYQMTAGRPGTRRVRHDGWVLVKLWVPAGEGTLSTATLAESVRQIFQCAEIYADSGGEPVTTMASSSGANAVDGRWFMQVIQTPFWYVETF